MFKALIGVNEVYRVSENIINFKELFSIPVTYDYNSNVLDISGKKTHQMISALISGFVF